MVGYVMAAADEGTLRLLEFGMDSPDRQMLLTLLGAARAEAEAHGCTRFSCPRPPGTWGGLLEEMFEPVSNPEVVYMAASLGPNLDLAALAKGEGGYWETDRI